MIRLPPRSTRTYQRVPYPTLFRSLNTYRPTTSTKVQTIRQKRIVAANPHTTFSMRWRGAADCPPAAGSPSPLLLKLANLGAQSLESRRPVDSLAASGRDPVAFEHT